MIDKLIREYIIARMNDEEEALEEFVRIGAKEAAAFQRSLLGNNAAIISFIDSLQEESISEDLERAAREYEQTRNDLDVVSDNQMVERAFKAGAEWQKQQMMKDAVEGWIEADDNRDMSVWARSENFRFLKERITTPLNVGDKVKLIIIKEE